MQASFLVPQYDGVAVFFAAIGAAISYGRMSASQVKTWGLSYIFDLIFQSNPKGRWRLVVELLVFVVIGVLVAVGLTQPTNVMQALTAGLGWTALVAKQR